MPTTSVIYAAMPTELGSVVSYARLAEQTSGNRLWCGQTLTMESHHLFAALSTLGLDLSYGTAVSVMPMRHPLTAALNARSIAALSQRPFVAGIGPGAAVLQERLLKTPYRQPVRATRQYATMLRTLANNGIAEAPDGPWETTGISLPTLPTPPVEVGLGVLRESMARLAGEIADWAITWLTPASWLAKSIAPALREGHERGDPSRPLPKTAAVVQCAVSRPGRDLVHIARRAAGTHLSAPHYTDMLRRAGIPADADDPDKGARLLVEHGVLAHGSPREIASQLAVYHAAGVDEVIVNVGGVHLAEGAGSALNDLAAILNAVEEREQQR
ncbi:LLM class flavin-dependent oxidoreductase [Streptomyces sp. SID12501]|uniref:LLM class flavin-dependent oxidoreductase n=1 Tax=Streptomyces sp. SID12501 TaxID=2706042 RepID=A0A6B3BHE7_9ACTN|nr:LLM class flavin-dependent oxidoreductase [Streptomyces sp. SID12501]NEC84714.1 LLM class flavin-dependent oxidoreductase [Streptomyces sp. SID12501]